LKAVSVLKGAKRCSITPNRSLQKLKLLTGVIMSFPPFLSFLSRITVFILLSISTVGRRNKKLISSRKDFIRLLELSSVCIGMILLLGSCKDNNGSVGAMVDDLTIEGEISLALSEASLTLAQGESGTVTITITRGGGFSGIVTLSLEDAPEGVTGTFDPMSIPNGEHESSLTLNGAADASAEESELTIMAEGDGVANATATLGLVIEKTSRVEENGLTREINETVPDTLLDRMLEMGMQIHRGPEPPSIEGVFHISPLMLLESNVPGDPSTHQFPDYYLQFTDQDNQVLTVTTDYVHGPSTGVGLGTFIVGSEDAFSVFANITLVHQADTARVLEVYSGTVTTEGIEDFYVANFMLDNGGHRQFIPNGTGRVAYDEVGFSPRISELPSALLNAQLDTEPIGARTLLSRIVQEH
jgi:hypothetical protein